VTASHDAKLTSFYEHWTGRFAEDPNVNGRAIFAFFFFGLVTEDIMFCRSSYRVPLFSTTIVGVTSIRHFLKKGSTYPSPSLVEYSRLVMYSFGFQHAFQRGLEPGDHIFFTKVGKNGLFFVVFLVERLCV
jgi:hypothetical protein